MQRCALCAGIEGAQARLGALPSCRHNCGYGCGAQGSAARPGNAQDDDEDLDLDAMAQVGQRG